MIWLFFNLMAMLTLFIYFIKIDGEWNGNMVIIRQMINECDELLKIIFTSEEMISLLFLLYFYCFFIYSYFLFFLRYPPSLFFKFQFCTLHLHYSLNPSILIPSSSLFFQPQYSYSFLLKSFMCIIFSDIFSSL